MDRRKFLVGLLALPIAAAYKPRFASGGVIPYSRYLVGVNPPETVIPRHLKAFLANEYWVRASLSGAAGVIIPMAQVKRAIMDEWPEYEAIYAKLDSEVG
jgi:hypothetical protein